MYDSLRSEARFVEPLGDTVERGHTWDSACLFVVAPDGEGIVWLVYAEFLESAIFRLQYVFFESQLVEFSLLNLNYWSQIYCSISNLIQASKINN